MIGGPNRRADNDWLHLEIVRADCPQVSSRYTDRLVTASIVFDSHALNRLIEVMGSVRFMCGSDYPFPTGEQKPV